MFYIAMAAPTSGATSPARHSPACPAPAASSSPCVRSPAVGSILHNDAQGDAGLPRGWVILGLGLAVACLSGSDVTRFSDRKALHRNSADKEPQPVLARTRTDDP
ncbi:hypothetical protein [Streptomyces sp. LUP47B]|uniref:hypothetical protein n=1 Tax=Streptomyces sp. LUP47B TaxID=1890286 RepID=UPI00114CF36A|nr:hypothetical protein [Streptomyces sp. LUP47B]